MQGCGWEWCGRNPPCGDGFCCRPMLPPPLPPPPPQTQIRCSMQQQNALSPPRLGNKPAHCWRRCWLQVVVRGVVTLQLGAIQVLQHAYMKGVYNVLRSWLWIKRLQSEALDFRGPEREIIRSVALITLGDRLHGPPGRPTPPVLATNNRPATPSPSTCLPPTAQSLCRCHAHAAVSGRWIQPDTLPATGKPQAGRSLDVWLRR